MLGKVIAVDENVVEIALNDSLTGVKNLLNYHVIFEEANLKAVGEVKEVNVNKIRATLLGEIVGNKFLSGVIKRPSLDTDCRIIQKSELDILIGNNDVQDEKKLYVGKMPLYDNYPVSIKINDFFAHHFAIFGNTGSGKSYSVTRILQNIFYNTQNIPDKARILFLMLMVNINKLLLN